MIKIDNSEKSLNEINDLIVKGNVMKCIADYGN